MDDDRVTLTTAVQCVYNEMLPGTELTVAQFAKLAREYAGYDLGVGPVVANLKLHGLLTPVSNGNKLGVAK